MAISQAPQQWIQQVFLIGIMAVLAACGGSDKKDTTPDAFSFAPVNNAVPGTDTNSAAITVAGINKAAPISITGGSYAIDSGAFTTAASTVKKNQRVVVRVKASAQAETAAAATLNIGGVSATFTVTTLADTAAPTAEITFPPAVSMKDGASIIVRGKAADDYSAISALTVNGVAAVTTDGFANWTAEVPLLEGQNTLIVQVGDAKNNSSANADSVSVLRAPFETAFPDNEVPITRADGIVFDPTNNRALVTNRQFTGGIAAVIAVDLSSGARSILSGPTTPDNINEFGIPEGLAIDRVADRNRALVADRMGAIIAVNLADGSRTFLSNASTPNNQQPAAGAFTDVSIDPVNENIAYIVDDSLRSLQRLDLSTGERALISDNDLPNTGIEFDTPTSVLIDLANNRAIVADMSWNALIAVDLTTGVRSMFFSGVPPATEICPADIVTDNIQSRIYISDCVDGINILDIATQTVTTIPIEGFGFMDINPTYAYALYMDRIADTLYAVDLTSQEYVVLSKSVGD